ncbi:MAG: DNA mismatch repair protein MutL [Ignavibacteriae bacterium HGW-Ignavibacteriae-3]|nr:MAG: DNA mismatch repair protein MutL [Ignavibacteriae bacterium HGW-Ignavibacteriae-3]
MNNKIKILPENLANKIAAGEVVNRPESVVKELVENSIDAGAKNIDIMIKGAGKVLIQVADDGEGMYEDDALLSIQRHATSKISTLDDLEAIGTFGFRGEALASIASVSIFELKTERRDQELGTFIKIDDNSVISKEKGSFSKGTSISVKNLFYNVPARRNFLKTNQTELKHIIETFKKLSLSHPEVGFKFYNDDEIVFDFPKSSIHERMKLVFADNILDAVIEVKELTDYISLTGFVAKPAYLRRSKGSQYFFLNKRFVQSKIVNHAVFQAFENVLEKGDYPFFVLYMNIDQKKVDVNVHPSKLEVKFDDESEIHSFVQAVIKKTIGSFDLIPSMTFNGAPSDRESLSFRDFRKTDKDDFTDRPFSNQRNESLRRPAILSDEEVDRLFNDLNREINSGSAAIPVTAPFDDRQNTEVYHENASLQNNETPFLVLLHNKYILTQIKSGLMIIDSHVAHERILYEKAMQSFDANIPFAQHLLFPQKINLDPADYQLTKELEPYLTNLGFEIKFQPKNTVLIVGIPSDVKVEHEVETLLDILHEYRKNEQLSQLEVRDNLAKSYSCKAAIKAGDKLTENEMRILVDKLFATSMPYVCPHGRPIVIKIPLEEFDKRFGRT